MVIPPPLPAAPASFPTQHWDWGEVPGGSTNHHLPPPAAVGARSRAGPAGAGGEGSEGFAGLKDASRRGFALRAVSRVGCLPDLEEKPGQLPPQHLSASPPSPPNRFICHLTPIPIIVCNCDMIYCPSPRHFSFDRTTREGFFNSPPPPTFLSFLHLEKRQGKGKNEEKGTGRRSLGEATRGRREEREDLNGKVTFQASSRRVF